MIWVSPRSERTDPLVPTSTYYRSFRSGVPRLAHLVAGDARTVERHVRLRAPRCGEGVPVPRARSAVGEAAPLCRIGRWCARLRVRIEGAARAPAAAPHTRYPCGRR